MCSILLDLMPHRVFLEQKFGISRIIAYICGSSPQLQKMRDSEDHVEFKKGENGNVSYNGAGKANPKDRHKCILDESL